MAGLDGIGCASASHLATSASRASAISVKVARLLGWVAQHFSIILLHAGSQSFGLLGLSVPFITPCSTNTSIKQLAFCVLESHQMGQQKVRLDQRGFKSVDKKTGSNL